MNKKANKKNIARRFLVAGFFVLLVFVSLLDSSPANAVINDYNKNATSTLTATEWNNLLLDFLNTGGGRVNGSVGINTATSSSYILNVSGGGYFSQPIVVGTPTDVSHAATMGYINSVITGGSGSTVGYWAMNGTNINNTNSGNVGIGTTAPDAKLSLNNALTQGQATTTPNQFSIYDTPSATSGRYSSQLIVTEPRPTADSAAMIFGSSVNVNVPATMAYNFSGNMFVQRNELDYSGTGNAGSINGAYNAVLFKSNSTATNVLGNTGYAYNMNGGTVTTMRGINVVSTNQGVGGVVTTNYGIGVGASNANTGSIGTNYVGYFKANNSNASGTITSNYGIYVDDLTNAGTITNTTGLYIGNQTAGTQTNAPFGIYQSGVNDKNYFAGNVGIGATNPTSLLQLSAPNTTGAIITLNTNNTATANGAIKWTNQSGTLQAFIGNNYNVSDSGGALEFGTGGGTTRMFINSSGNVGIGNTAPGAKLDVTGSLRNSLATTHTLLGSAGNVVVMADNTGTLYSTPLATFVSSNSLDLWEGAKNGNIWNGDAGAGNVGIGRTNPSQKLHVEGVSATEAQFLSYDVNAPQIVLNHSSAGWGLIQNDAAGKWSLGYNGTTAFNTLGTPVLTWTNGGSVGVGITNPSAKFQVHGGDMKFSSVANGYLYFGQDGVGTYMEQVGNNTSNENYRLQSSKSGDTTNYSQLFIDPTSGFSFMTIGTGNGNVGIGITNPGTKLDVVGSLRNSLATTHTLLGGAGNVVVMADNTGTLYNSPIDTFVSANSLDLWKGTKNGNIWNGDAGSGNVGIGTTNPGQKLEVNGDVLVAHSNKIGFRYSGADNNFYSYMEGYPASGALTLAGGLWTSSDTQEGIRFETKTAGSVKMSILNNGNVGIGTTNPGAKLQISDTDKVISSMYDNSNLKIYTTDALAADKGGSLMLGGVYSNDGSTVGFAGIKGGKENATAWNYNGYLSFVTSGAGSTEKMRITSGGNVGIGTTNPGGKFVVKQSGVGWTDGINLERSATTDRFNFTHDSAGRLLVGYNSADVMGIYSSGISIGNSTYSQATPPSNGLLVQGNVGVGTTAPISKLNVHSGTGDGATYDSIFSLSRKSSTGNIETGKIVMDDKDTNWANMIFKVKTTASAGEDDSFYTNAVTIDGQNTNVGIGITNPGTKLDVSGSLRNSLATTHSLLGGAGNVVVMADNTGTLYNTPLATFASANSLWGGTKNGNIWNGDAGAGNVGIGVNNPLVKLTLYGTGSVPLSGDNNASLFRIVENSGGNGIDFGAKWVPGVTAYGWIQAQFMGGVAYENLLLNPLGGNVGIGATDPSTKLSIAGGDDASGQGVLELRTSGGTNLKIGGNTTYSWIQSHSSKPLHINDLGNNVILNSTGGAVGIGLTSPGVKLDIAGAFRNSLATTHSLLGAAGNVVVMADNNGTLYSTPLATFASNITGNYLPLSGGSLTGNLNMGGHDILNINKLTVNTIDPLYNIKGTNYSTFASSIAGGVKEEYIGRADIKAKSSVDGEREYVIDFDNLEHGSDLWVWRQTVDFSDKNVEVLITPYGGFAQVYSSIESNKIIFKADRPVSVHYRLSGRRVDWKNWPTKAHNQTEKAGFVIE